MADRTVRDKPRQQPPVRPGRQSGDRSDVDRHTGEIIGDHQHRPWSEQEVQIEMQRVMKALDDDVDKLLTYGHQKALSQNALDRERARQLLICRRDRKDMSSDKLREAWIIDQTLEDGETSIADLMLQADSDATIYWDQQAILKARMAQADVLRSMMRTARDNTESWPENRGGRR